MKPPQLSHNPRPAILPKQGSYVVGQVELISCREVATGGFWVWINKHEGGSQSEAVRCSFQRAENPATGLKAAAMTWFASRFTHRDSRSRSHDSEPRQRDGRMSKAEYSAAFEASGPRRRVSEQRSQFTAWSSAASMITTVSPISPEEANA